MHTKGQNAIEFLTTYSFSFLIIAMVLVLLLLFAAIPNTAFPTECSFYSGFSCSDSAYFGYGAGSQFTIAGTDAQQGIVNISNFSATIGSVLSTNGFCTPSVVTAGQTFYCLANFTTRINVGQTYTGTFKVSANYCAASVGSLENGTCIASNSFAFAGQSRLEAGSYSPSDLPPIQNIYCIGSSTGSLSQVYYASISNISKGTSASWISTVNTPVAVSTTGCSIYHNYVYCTGSDSNPYTQVYYAPLQNNGVGNWIKTTSYPIQLTHAGCSIYQGQIYCVGSSTGSENQIYYAKISTKGVGTWTSTTNTPETMTNSGCTVYNGFMYCVGDSSSGVENDVFYAPLTSNGVGKWTQTSSYPIQFNNAGCSAYNGYIYCVGSSIGNENQSYYAPISSTGIGTWESTTPYPIADIHDNGCFITDGNIYCVGSASGSNKQVYYASVTSSGIGAWTASAATYPIVLQNAYCEVPGAGGGLYGGGGPD